jgi:CheY-like chemotaxis protein
MQPAEAASAPEAMALMEQASVNGHPFHLLLIDLHMPGMDGFDLASQIRTSRNLSETVIMMLTSGEQRGDAARCRELGISMYLTKPVRREELRKAIATLLASQSQTRTTSDLSMLRDSARAPRSAVKSRSILLVEDNEVNQRVALRILEKEGHQVVVAANGREALMILNQQTFDVVLMDAQMPEMDGFATASAIRQNEKGSGKHIPIIATTAHAMVGDRERCLAAGMDGYISKPVNARDLLKLVDSLANPPQIAVNS